MTVKHIEKRVELLDFSEIDKESQEDYKKHYEDSRFFVYRGVTYCLGEVMRLDGCGWDGNLTLTNTSALLIKLTDDYDFITVGLAG